MIYKKSEIESGLKKKGFKLDVSPHHRYLHHIIEGKTTGVSTYTSHGIKEYNSYLLDKIKKQLKLDSISQLSNLLNCPMSSEKYVEHLRSKEVI